MRNGNSFANTGCALFLSCVYPFSISLDIADLTTSRHQIHCVIEGFFFACSFCIQVNALYCQQFPNFHGPSSSIMLNGFYLICAHFIILICRKIKTSFGSSPADQVPLPLSQALPKRPMHFLYIPPSERLFHRFHAPNIQQEILPPWNRQLRRN